MIELSDQTEALVSKLIADVDQRRIVSEKLRSECSDNIYTCSDGTPESLERIRFAVLKLLSESVPEHDIDYWIEVAKTDWRDLFMMAGFGYDVNEHKKWGKLTLTKT